jgi:hypothetical protein
MKFFLFATAWLTGIYAWPMAVSLAMDFVANTHKCQVQAEVVAFLFGIHVVTALLSGITIGEKKKNQ